MNARFMTSKWRPNFFCISSRHWRLTDAGQTTSMNSTRWRRSSSCAMSPASMVFPRPTSSAMKTLARGSASAFCSGVSWWFISLMPARNGDWKSSASVAVTQFHLSAWRYAAKCRGGSMRSSVAEAVRLRLVHLRAELELPEHLEGAPLVVVVEADELDERRVPLGRRRNDVLDEPLAVAHLDDVAAVRRVARDCVRREERSRGRALGRAVGLEEAGGEEGPRAARVVEAVGPAGGLQLVAAEGSEQSRNRIVEDAAARRPGPPSSHRAGHRRRRRASSRSRAFGSGRSTVRAEGEVAVADATRPCLRDVTPAYPRTRPYGTTRHGPAGSLYPRHVPLQSFHFQRYRSFAELDEIDLGRRLTLLLG